MARIEFSYECGTRTPASYVTNIAKAWNYPETILVDGEVVPNPETKANYCKRVLKQQLIEADYQGASIIAREATVITRGTLED